jgi:hypothetical protein
MCDAVHSQISEEGIYTSINDFGIFHVRENKNAFCFTLQAKFSLD